MGKRNNQRLLELFNNQKIGVKILIGYMLAFMLAAAVGVLAVYQFGQVSATISRLTGALALERDLAEKTAIQIHLVRLRAGQYIYQGQNPDDLQAYNQALGDAQSLMNAADQINGQTDRAEAQAQIRKDFNNFAAAFAEIVQILAARQATINDVLTPQGALSAEKLALLRNNNYEILDFTTAYYASQARETFSQMQMNVIQYLATGNEQYASQVDADYAIIRSAFDLLQDSARDDPSRLLLNEIETATTTYYRGFQNAQTDIAIQHALTAQLDTLGPAIVTKPTAIADDINAEFSAQSQQVNTRVEQLQSWTVLAIFLTMIVGLIFALLLSRAITRPIEQMARAAQRVAAGAFDQQVEVPGKDELGILAGAFNEMTTRFRETMATLMEEIAERKRAEENIRKLNDELEAFSYSVSHDLRAPLRSMEGFSGILLSNYRDKLDEQGQHYLERIQQAAQHMGQLINDLLNLSRITRSELVRQSVDLGNLAREVAAELQTLDPQRQAEFVIAEPLTVQGDARLLRIALQNLLGNAWKFSGTRPKTVIEVGQMTVADFKLQNEDSEASLRDLDSRLSQSEISNPQSKIYYVRDNGVGFDMDYAARLFAPFQRLHAMNEFPGTGIGLAIVQRVISRHGGRIWPQAQVGQGATFYFTLG